MAEITERLQFETPSSFSARSGFDTESGAITGDSLAVGGTWAGAGDTDDFSAGSGVATRTAVSDANTETGRYAIAGASTPTNTVVQVDLKQSSFGNVIGSGATHMGVFARYTDTSNWLMATLRPNVAGTPAGGDHGTHRSWPRRCRPSC